MREPYLLSDILVGDHAAPEYAIVLVFPTTAGHHDEHKQLEQRMTAQFGHGDMFLRRVEPDQLPAGIKERLDAGTDRRAVLAEGEQTGHVHLLTSERPLGLVRDSDMVAYVLLRDAGLLTHEEHGVRTLEPGYYEVPTERDYDPTMYARRVVD